MKNPKERWKHLPTNLKNGLLLAPLLYIPALLLSLWTLYYPYGHDMLSFIRFTLFESLTIALVIVCFYNVRMIRKHMDKPLMNRITIGTIIGFLILFLALIIIARLL